MFSEGIKIPGKYFALSALASLALSACADIVPKEKSQAQGQRSKQEEIKRAFEQKGFQVSPLKDGLLVVGDLDQGRADILQILEESEHNLKINIFSEDYICIGAVISEFEEIEAIDLQKQVVQTIENAENVLKEAGFEVQRYPGNVLLITGKNQKEIKAMLKCNGIVIDNFHIKLIENSKNSLVIPKNKSTNSEK